MAKPEPEPASSQVPFPSTGASSPTSPSDDHDPSSNQLRPRKPYYTPLNPRQFSSSAAKRDSVMALGSIAHLQHYFVRNGLATRNRPTNHKHMVLAVPGNEFEQVREEDEQLMQNLPPEPAPPPPVPAQPYFPPGRALPNLTDLESARQEVMAQLDQVCECWGLVELAATRAPSAASTRSGDEPMRSTSLSVSGGTPTSPRGGDEFVVRLLTLTTRAVRAVQNFMLTLPDPDILLSTTVGGLGGGDLQRRMTQLELSTAARPRISHIARSNPRSRASSPAPGETSGHRASFDPFALFKKRAVSGPAFAAQPTREREDPLSILRKMSLEVLGCLKDIEHRFRVPGSGTPTTAQAFAEEHDDADSVLGLPSMGWEYRADVGLDEVRTEALVVKQWLGCVDGILEGMSIINRRKKLGRASGAGSRERNKVNKGHTSSAPGSSTAGSGDVPKIALDDIDDGPMAEDEAEGLLPDWACAQPSSGAENESGDGGALQRLFRCLVSLLPAELLGHLCPPHGDSGSRLGFLDSLSDGTLLCLAYNVALRQSERPWGFIPVESIHDLIHPRQGEPTGEELVPNPARRASASGENNAKVGLTFRRMENVRLWAAALKLRYLIKSEPLPTSELAKRAGAGQPVPIRFDPRAVARKYEEWDTMLETIAVRWLDAVAAEKREEILGR